MVQCTLCGQTVDSIAHIAEQATLELIQKMNPTWKQKDGGCPKCIDYYRNLDSQVEHVPSKPI